MTKFRKTLAVLLSAIMLLSALNLSVLAAGGDLSLDISKSKTVTELDTDTWTCDVTVSLPSAETDVPTDVLLVLDASECAKDMITGTVALLDNLIAQVETGADIKVGIVMFKGNAVPFKALDGANDAESLKTLRNTLAGLVIEDDPDGEQTKDNIRAYVAQTFSEFMNKGTNIPAALQLAKNMLEDDSEVADARKFVVLVSDGDTYLYCHSDGSDYDYTKAYTRAGPGKGYIGGIYEVNNWDVGDSAPVRTLYYAAKDTTDADAWDEYLDYVGEHNADFSAYDFEADAQAFKNDTFPDYFTDDMLIPADSADRIINSDVSRYQTAELYKQLQSSYNCYYCYLPGGNDMARTMLRAFTPADRLIDAADAADTNIFSGIEKDILYAVGAGSVVTDEIGDDFDFVRGSLGMAVNGTSLASLPVGDVTYFGSEGEVSADNYRFMVEYDETADKLTWTINENVSNFAPVQLTYTLKLVQPQTAVGTYNVPTSKSMTLTPKDSRGNAGDELNFAELDVTYDVSGSASKGDSYRYDDDDDDDDDKPSGGSSSTSGSTTGGSTTTPTAAEGEIIIDDEDVPLGDAPVTGAEYDPAVSLYIFIAAAIGLAAILLAGRKKTGIENK